MSQKKLDQFLCQMSRDMKIYRDVLSQKSGHLQMSRIQELGHFDFILRAKILKPQKR